MGLDEVDWYAIVIDSGNQTSIALSAEGANLEVAVLNGSASLGQGTVDDEIRWVTISALNDDSEGMALLYHIRVTWDPANPGGPYQLRLVTADASTETDLTPPPAPQIISQDEWTHADEIVIHWPPVVDNLSGTSHYEVRWAGGLWAPVSENESLANLSMLMDGRYSFEVRAIDAAGNVGPANATWIRVDRQVPIVSIEQIDAKRSPVSKLVVALSIDDGDGSGPSLIEWSADNSTWSGYPEDGLILWDDWNNTHLYIRVTDGANLVAISELEIDIPAEETESVDDAGNDEESTPQSGGGVSSMLAILVVLAIIALSVFTVILALKLKARRELEEELEDELEEGDEEPESPEQIEETPETYHVPDHTHLIGGGVYDQSTGFTAYIDPEGRWWWEQEDGSFYHDPALNANDATQDDLP